LRGRRFAASEAGFSNAGQAKKLRGGDPGIEATASPLAKKSAALAPMAAALP